VKKNYTFLLNCGYAEDAYLSYLPFTSRYKFATAREALIDLALFIKEQYVQRYAHEPKKCCKANRAKDPSAEFCAKCGHKIANEEFDPQGYMQFILDMACCCTVDSFHGNFIDYDEDARWQSEGINTKDAIRCVYVAEKVLAAAIGHSPDDRVNIESIFKDRTKSKDNSFSFW
jgi:hypothetical protein